MAMDCETCQPTLLDLVHGELDPVLATQVQQHMAGCAGCRADMERLTTGLQLARQLPVVEPPSALGERLLELAASRAEQVRRAHAPKRRSLWQSLLDFVGQFAMTPQVGMATISLLIVAVGLWSVPRLSREPEAAGVTVVNPDPEGQAGPSAGLQPAERLDLAVDTRGKRIRPREDAIELACCAESAAQSNAAPSAEPAAPAPPASANTAEPAPAEVAMAAEPALAEDEAAALRLSGATTGDDSPKPQPEFSRRARYTGSDSKLESGLGAMAAADSANAAEGVAPMREAEKDERFAAAPPPASPAPAAPAAGGAAQDDLAAISRPAAKGDGLVARKPAAPTKTASSASPATALKDVRALQASGGCKAAVPGYERLISAFPNSSEAGEATLALAACYRSLGQEALARQLLDRALRRPATAARARAMLAPPAADQKTLEAQERK